MTNCVYNCLGRQWVRNSVIVHTTYFKASMALMLPPSTITKARCASTISSTYHALCSNTACGSVRNRLPNCTLLLTPSNVPSSRSTILLFRRKRRPETFNKRKQSCKHNTTPPYRLPLPIGPQKLTYSLDSGYDWRRAFRLLADFYARQHICYSASLRQRRVRPSVCLSVCLSHAGIVPSRAKAGSWNVHHLIAPWF